MLPPGSSARASESANRPRPHAPERDRRARSRLLLAPLSLCLMLLLGCGATPTLPLPPPAALTVVGPNSEGRLVVAGQANDDAYVTVMNQRLNRGWIGQADEQGLFELEVSGAPGDRLSVWQEIDGLEGERVELSVPSATR